MSRIKNKPTNISDGTTRYCPLTISDSSCFVKVILGRRYVTRQRYSPMCDVCGAFDLTKPRGNRQPFQHKMLLTCVDSLSVLIDLFLQQSVCQYCHERDQSSMRISHRHKRRRLTVFEDCLIHTVDISKGINTL